jgi:exodeoxyribonuclease-3
MKILTYNVNGIRAALGKDLVSFLKREKPDVLCLQEIKANIEDIDPGVFKAAGLHYVNFYSAQKKGYSGVAILSRNKPSELEVGCGHELFDFEGRVMRANFEGVNVVNAYFPSGTTGDVRQTIKYEFLDHFYSFINKLKKKEPAVVVCGDYNICHKPIDIHDPIRNKDSSGFLPDERAWMDKWFDNGMIDSFRKFNPEPDHYTWWSYRAGARKNNKGWRIDYISVSEALNQKLKGSSILSEDVHSDHCGMHIQLN